MPEVIPYGKLRTASAVYALPLFLSFSVGALNIGSILIGVPLLKILPVPALGTRGDELISFFQMSWMIAPIVGIAMGIFSRLLRLSWAKWAILLNLLAYPLFIAVDHIAAHYLH